MEAVELGELKPVVLALKGLPWVIIHSDFKSNVDSLARPCLKIQNREKKNNA